MAVKTKKILKLLLWKSLLFYKRQWHVTFVVTFLPVVAVLLFANLRKPLKLCEKKYITEPEYRVVKSINSVLPIDLYYAPTNKNIAKVMNNLEEILKVNKTKSFKTETELLGHIRNRNGTVAVIFDSLSPEEWPKKMRYRIRSSLFDRDFETLFADEWPFKSYQKEKYFLEFISIQHAVDLAYITTISEDILPKITITFQEMPYPPHETFIYGNCFNIYLVAILVITSSVQIYFFTHVISEERLSGVKELLKMTGVEPWMFWISWSIHCIVPQIIANTLFVLFLKIDIPSGQNILVEYGSASIIWVFLLLYSIQLVCTCFVFSSLFSNAEIGSWLALGYWFATPFLTMLVTFDEPNCNIYMKFLTMFIPNVCMTLGINAIGQFEMMGGVSWNDIYTQPSAFTCHPSMGYIFLMLIVSGVITFILAWYISSVWPGYYGIGQSWFFPLKRSYWRMQKHAVMYKSDKGSATIHPSIETSTNDLVESIQLRNLSKSYQNKKAVNKLNVDIYENCVTVILGHNGAGKTSTIKMVSGFIRPTGGTTHIDGLDLQLNMKLLRKNIGVCPQRSSLIPHLTTREHIILFGMLRGLKHQETRFEAKRMLSKLQIYTKANVMASKLSETMKRKLSIFIAMVGNCKYLLLDDPTFGLDSTVKRGIWDLLLQLRNDHTILLTTHSLEEAEIMGDKIMIMHMGKLLSYGSSNFLHNYYEIGYVLNVVMTKGWTSRTVQQVIKSFLPKAKVRSHQSGNICFSLASATTAILSRLLNELTRYKLNFGLTHFGVSIVTMEEVFLKIGELVDKREKDNISQPQTPTKQRLSFDFQNYSDDEVKPLRPNKYDSIKRQFIGMLLKRYYYVRFNWLLYLVLLLPAIYEATGGFYIRRALKESPNIYINLSLTAYLDPFVYFSTTDQTDGLSNWYIETATSESANMEEVEDVFASIIEQGKADVETYHRSLIAAAEFNYTEDIIINALYGNFARHGPPITLNLISNALIKFMMNSSEYTITVTNNPLPTSEVYRRELMDLEVLLMYLLLLILAALLVKFSHEEYRTGIKHLQMVAGVPRTVYWFANFIIDVLLFTIAVFMSQLIVFVTDLEGPFGSSFYALFANGLLMFLFAWGLFPFCYSFTSSHKRYSMVLLYIMFFSIGGFILQNIIMYLIDDGMGIIDDLLCVVPSYSFTHGKLAAIRKTYMVYLWEYQSTEMKNALCASNETAYPCCKPNSLECQRFLSFFSGDNSVLFNSVMMGFAFFLYSFFLLFHDSGLADMWCANKIFYRKKIQRSIDEDLDEDVNKEKQAIERQVQKPTRIVDVLIVRNVKKWISDVYALRGINIRVHLGECFGLLGVTGSGKTMTFRILTGETFQSSGDCYVLGISTTKHKAACQKYIGYCPQEYSLNYSLTARQMLKTFGYIRGVPDDKMSDIVDNLIRICEFEDHENTPCGVYSDGCMRKLSTALAFIGDPPLVILDEPSTGLEPEAKRKIWEILKEMKKSGQSIILATHSIEECEAMCDRFAIMVDGQLKCIGNLQYLREKYSKGLTAIIKLKTSTNMKLIDFYGEVSVLKTTLDKSYICELKDETPTILHYHILGSTTLSDFFLFMEGLKVSHEHLIENYSVCETNLEQIVLLYAKTKNQREEDPIPWWNKNL